MLEMPLTPGANGHTSMDEARRESFFRRRSRGNEARPQNVDAINSVSDNQDSQEGGVAADALERELNRAKKAPKRPEHSRQSSMNVFHARDLADQVRDGSFTRGPA